MQSSVQILLWIMAVVAFLGVVLEEVIHVNKAKVVLLFGAQERPHVDATRSVHALGTVGARLGWHGRPGLQP